MYNVLTADAVKPQFSLKTFYSLVEQVSKKFPDMKVTDWKDIIKNKLNLSPEQRVSIDAVSEKTNAKMQQHFIEIADHAKKGNTITGKIIINEDQSHTVFIFLESVKFTGGSMFTMLRIAHCDANCENWGWG